MQWAYCKHILPFSVAMVIKSGTSQFKHATSVACHTGTGHTGQWKMEKNVWWKVWMSCKENNSFSSWNERRMKMPHNRRRPYGERKNCRCSVWCALDEVTTMPYKFLESINNVLSVPISQQINYNITKFNAPARGAYERIEMSIRKTYAIPMFRCHQTRSFSVVSLLVYNGQATAISKPMEQTLNEWRADRATSLKSHWPLTDDGRW